jgi:hypothetical protein
MCACKIKGKSKNMMRSIMVGREKKWGRCVSDLHPAFLSRHQPSFEKSPDIETDVELTVSADNLSLDALIISQVQGHTENVRRVQSVLDSLKMSQFKGGQERLLQSFESLGKIEAATNTGRR